MTAKSVCTAGVLAGAVCPTLGRIQIIGYELGQDGRAPEWYRANHRTPWVAK